MAVHPPARPSSILTVLTGLVVLTVIPLAIIVVPNTISVVAGSMPEELRQAGMLRAYGLAVPALVATIPVAAVIVRLRGPAGVLAAGLAFIALADFSGGFASEVWHVAVLRVLHGAGSGLVLPATLMAVRERPAPARGWLIAIWSATLTSGLVAAQAIALWPLLAPQPGWQIVLQPYPMFAGIALIVTAAYVVVRRISPAGKPIPAPSSTERSHLTMAAVPATGIALLAIGTTFQWPLGWQIAAAVLAIVALCGLAFIGCGEGAPGRTVAFVLLAIGLAVLPAAAQATSPALRSFGGPGLGGPFWLALAGAVALALVGAVAAGPLAPANGGLLRDGVRLAPAGLIILVAGLASIRLVVPTGSALTLALPFGLMAAGGAIALVGALNRGDIGAGLFGLALCFPGIQVGFLLGGAIQVASLQGAVSGLRTPTMEAVISGLLASARLWAVAAALIVVIIIGLNTYVGAKEGKLPPLSPIQEE